MAPRMMHGGTLGDAVNKARGVAHVQMSEQQTEKGNFWKVQGPVEDQVNIKYKSASTPKQTT